MKIDELTREQTETVRDGFCDGCKGNIYFWESECYLACDGFKKEAEEIEEDL